MITLKIYKYMFKSEVLVLQKSDLIESAKLKSPSKIQISDFLTEVRKEIQIANVAVYHEIVIKNRW